MKSKILILLLGGLGLLASRTTGQSTSPTVLAAGGGAAGNGKIQVAWTLGEPIIQTAGMVTQGFHSAEIQVLSSTASPAADCWVHTFPNPVSHALTLQFNGAKPGAVVQAVVRNALAQQLLATAIPAGAADYDLDCTVLPPGAYVLTLRSEDGWVLSSVHFLKN